MDLCLTPAGQLAGIDRIAYDGYGNNTSSTDGRTIAHTAFDKPRSIAKGNHATTFAYGPDRSRFKRRIFGTYTVEGGMETFGDSRFEFQVPEGSRLNLHAKGAAVRACGFWCAACSAVGAFPTGFCG